MVKTGLKATIHTQGRIVIPKEIRDTLGIKPNDTYEFAIDDNMKDIILINSNLNKQQALEKCFFLNNLDISPSEENKKLFNEEIERIYNKLKANESEEV
jgi:AbrB family looped-hinge helix DNA binding protein